MSSDEIFPSPECLQAPPIPTFIIVLLVKNTGLIVGWPLVMPGKRPKVAVALHKSRRSLRFILEEKQFSLNFIPYSITDKAIQVFASKVSEKLKLWDNRKKCENINCYSLPEASLVVECILDNYFEINDHVIIVGRAVSWYGNSDRFAIFLKNRIYDFSIKL